MRFDFTTDDAILFYLFFGPTGFRATGLHKSLVARAIEGSSAYRIGVGEDLRQRAFEAVRLATDGLLTYSQNGLNSTEHLDQCRRQSFILVYRLLFIMFAEDRGILPYATNKDYRDNRSLSLHRNLVARRLDEAKRRGSEDYSRDSCDMLAELRSLFDLVDHGNKSYGVHAYNGGLFDRESNPFLNDNQISDWHLSRIIDQLGRAADPELEKGGLFRVDYRDLAIQHLGSIYEGLLELQPRLATVPMRVVVRRSKERVEERTIPVSHPGMEGFENTGELYETGQVYLETNKGERRASGSYYTPDHIVNHLIEHTLGPLCERVESDLNREIEAAKGELARGVESAAAKIEQLQGEYDDRILKLRVLDPSMGSGHFLLRACGYLAEQIATNPLTKDEASGESSLNYWKRRVSECCLYGVDLNDMAVELAKLAIWLETVAVNRPLTFLDHHFRCGNSLVGAKIDSLGKLPDSKGLFSKPFVRAVESKIPHLLSPLTKIESLPSRETSQVKAKEKLLLELEQARASFRNVADIWCSIFALPEMDRVHEADYRRLIDEIKVPQKFSEIITEESFQRGIKAAKSQFNCFHWELEFPEAFFAGPKRKPHPGFDAVIGNPPYDVLSELESGRSLGAFRACIKSDFIYAPSLRGKNNLYKLFVCRALDLLTDGGYLGFITPMAILGDDQSADLRRAMISNGTFTVIEAFPQKDDPNRRVFREAKLSTTAFVYRKLPDAEVDRISFTSRVHPGRDIEANSPQLRMRRQDIPMYDPSNCTMVSCSQADLELAVRIMQTGRMRRLKDVAQFFQGEVNETVQRRDGTIAGEPVDGHKKLVIRGANICLYVIREASQGNAIFLDVSKFLDGSSEESKAYHHRYPRIGLQESCPQNNFRRVIAAYIPPGEYCNHKVNYCPSHECRVDLRLLLGVLNSKLIDWYFRLGSTNAAVSHYQIYNLPFPLLRETKSVDEKKLVSTVMNWFESPKYDSKLAFHLVSHLTEAAPFDPAIGSVLVAAVERIEAIEKERGPIARNERSALCPRSQRYQDFIDQIIFALAGLTPEESSGLEVRLATML